MYYLQGHLMEAVKREKRGERGAKTAKMCKHSVCCPTPQCENGNLTYHWRKNAFIELNFVGSLKQSQAASEVQCVDSNS